MDPIDIDRLRDLYTLHRRALFLYALSLTGEREGAEDVVHEVVSRVLVRSELPTDPRPYLFRSIRNEAIDRMRRRQREPRPDPPAEIRFDEQLVRRKVIHDGLAALPADQREAIVLKVYGGLTFRGFAGIFEESENTVASRYRRGLDRLRLLIGEDPT